MTLLRIKPWLILTLIFILGVGTGISLTIGLGAHFRHPPGAQQMKNRMLTGLTRRLNLTAAQQAKIAPMLTSTVTQIKSVHQEEVRRIYPIMEAMRAQIMPILTPEQQTELQKMASERDARMLPGHMRSWEHSEPPPSPPEDFPHTNGPSSPSTPPVAPPDASPQK
jgi:hypothetical protein